MSFGISEEFDVTGLEDCNPERKYGAHVPEFGTTFVPAIEWVDNIQSCNVNVKGKYSEECEIETSDADGGIVTLVPEHAKGEDERGSVEGNESAVDDTGSVPAWLAKVVASLAFEKHLDVVHDERVLIWEEDVAKQEDERKEQKSGGGLDDQMDVKKSQTFDASTNIRKNYESAWAR